MEQLWIIFNVAAFNGRGTVYIVAESKVSKFLKEQTEGYQEELGEQYVDEAFADFKNFADAGWATNYSETVTLGSNTYHFQRLCGGSVYSAFLPDFMPLINLLDIARQ